MDRLTRKELKTDRFAAEVGHTVEYVGEHKQQVMKYSGVAVAAIIIAAAIFFYTRQQAGIRQQELTDAMNIQMASVGQPVPSSPLPTYATQEAKTRAYKEALTKLATSYPGSAEGLIAKYYLAIQANDTGKPAEAQKLFQEVADSSKEDYASLAKLSLARIYASQGRLPDAEKLLRSLIEKPTLFVSKGQATLALAEILAPTKPAEARKLLEPLRTERAAVSRAAMTALASIPAAPQK